MCLTTVRVTVACPSTTTEFSYLPHAAVAAPLIAECVTLAAIEHRQRCGRCDLSDVFRKDSRQLHTAVDRIVRNAVERAVGRGARDRHPASRRN